MKPRTLQAVADWINTTDLAAVSYRRDGETVELSRDGSRAHDAPAFPPCSLLPVTAHEVGLFRFSALGSARKAEKGSAVEKGQVLGLITAGKTHHEVKSPAAGGIVAVLIDDGDPVEYGQPLFFLRP